VRFRGIFGAWSNKGCVVPRHLGPDGRPWRTSLDDLGARLLTPDPEGLGPGPAVLAGDENFSTVVGIPTGPVRHLRQYLVSYRAVAADAAAKFLAASEEAADSRRDRSLPAARCFRPNSSRPASP
jgi:hypothetical protein